MKLELLTIGDELLLGFTIDTNAAYLARTLADEGVEIVRRATVGDEASEIAAAVRQALDRTGAVVTTGGLGPTSDDLTKPAIAELFGRQMIPNEDLWEALKRLWKERGRPGEIPESNRQQIMIPEGADVIVNRHGTAPGIWLEDDGGRWVAMFPGVPREMRGMVADELVPRLRRRMGSAGAVVRSRTIRTTGVAESQLPTLLGPLARGFPDMPLAYQPSQEGVDLRLTARGLSASEAHAVLTDAATQIRSCVGRYAYGEDGADLAAVVLDLCRAGRLRIGVAESCTGGLLGARLTAISGSSDVVLGGVIAYHNDVKQSVLGVRAETLAQHGAVSEPVALEMAAGARKATGAEVGMAITGVAGPGGGTPEKPVGMVWIAIDVDGTQRSYGGRFIGDRAEIRFRATQSALDMVRRTLESRHADSP
jgi:nicotinamide-nucleotide amidase